MASGGQHTPQNGKGSVDVQGKSRVVFSLNMFRHVLVVIIVVANLSSVELCAGPIGLERMERFDLLPVLTEGVQVRQVSSHDRSGGNNDGFDGEFSALYIDETGEYVMFDEIGAGCIYRFWVTYSSKDTAYAAERLRFYFDGETVPRIDMSIADFFSGTNAPFLFPLTGPFNKSSNGCYSYIPIPYETRLKVTFSRRPLFYNITYHVYDSATGVVSWDGSEDYSGVSALWNAVGSDPKSSGNNQVVSGSLAIHPGTTGVLFSATGTGVVNSIKIDPSPATEDVLRNVRLQMNWDGGDPEVDVPLGDFFGSGRHQINVLSLPIGMRTSGDWYCYFAMPYWQHADIRLVNNSASFLTGPYEVQTGINKYTRSDTACFNAQYHQESFGNDGWDYLFIEESGRGHLVGISLFMESSGSGGYQDMNYLEGDERLYIDGSQSPAIHGTGNEDYFNCGWYFNRGTFSRPSHGHPWRDQFNGGGTNLTQAYRFHLGDCLPYNRSIRFGIEHGPYNDSPGTYSSVAYFYQLPTQVQGLELLADLDMGDAWQESLYDFSPPPSASVVTGLWAYAGDDDGVMIEKSGYAYTGSLATFTVPCGAQYENLLIRRHTDRGVGGRKAHVFVDDAYAGIWYEADGNYSNMNQRWLDSERLINASYFDGKEEVEIGILPFAGSGWNEFGFKLYGVVKPERMLDEDDDQLPDFWELEHAADLSVLDGVSDFDLDGFLDFSEWQAGTGPDNNADRPSFSGFTNGPVLNTSIGSLYSVEMIMDLKSNQWSAVRENIPGNGRDMIIPADLTVTNGFYRFKVIR